MLSGSDADTKSMHLWSSVKIYRYLKIQNTTEWLSVLISEKMSIFP